MPLTLTDEQANRLRDFLNGDGGILSRAILRDELFPELALPIPSLVDKTWWISHEGNVYIWRAEKSKWEFLYRACNPESVVPTDSGLMLPAPAALPRTGEDSGDEPLDGDIVF
jgi:hypothetical protein